MKTQLYSLTEEVRKGLNDSPKMKIKIKDKDEMKELDFDED
jgi:hypothetical protein